MLYIDPAIRRGEESRRRMAGQKSIDATGGWAADGSLPTREVFIAGMLAHCGGEAEKWGADWDTLKASEG